MSTVAKVRKKCQKKKKAVNCEKPITYYEIFEMCFRVLATVRFFSNCSKMRDLGLQNHVLGLQNHDLGLQNHVLGLQNRPFGTTKSRFRTTKAEFRTTQFTRLYFFFLYCKKNNNQ